MKIDLDGIIALSPANAAVTLAKMYIIYIEGRKDPRGNILANGELARAESRIIDAAHAAYEVHGDVFKAALGTQNTDFYAKTFPNLRPHSRD